MYLKPYEKLSQFWQRSSSDVPVHGYRESEVAALETKYGVTLPADFRDYLLFACPSEHNYDENAGDWWPLADIKSIPEEYKHRISDKEIEGEGASCLFFADYMIWCWAWAICCAEGPYYGRVVVIDGLNDRFSAYSFSAFVNAHIAAKSYLA